MVENTTTDPVFKLETPETTLAHIWEWLENVCDPEVPVLSVLDLGVVRSISIVQNGEEITSPVTSKQTLEYTQVDQPRSDDSALRTPHSAFRIQITPTYTGCPAMSMIAANIQIELLAHGLKNVQVIESLSPAWTTDWMSEAGRQKLLAYGIAPPQSKARMEKLLFADMAVPCPLCGSENTERIAEFGSTACKSLHRCLDCREPFDYFKCH